MEVVSEETLPDGSSLVLRAMNHIARDDAGRTFTDKRRLVSTSFKDEPPLLSAQIYDPATGMLSRLDPYTRIARQSTLAAPPIAPTGTVPVIPDEARADASYRKEDLGTRTAFGMTIKGFRETRGNDTAEEFWYSPELSIYVERRMNQPRLKESVVITQIERNDPPAPEFVVPEDYKRVAVSVSAGGPRVQAPGPDGVYQIGRGVSAPQLQYSVDPQYSEEARAEKFQGVCIVGLTVDTHGGPQDVHVVRALGKGLDQKAIEAVQQYRFKPAVYEGRAVPVQMNIEVQFKIY